MDGVLCEHRNQGADDHAQNPVTGDLPELEQEVILNVDKLSLQNFNNLTHLCSPNRRCGCLFASEYVRDDLYNADFKCAAEYYKNNLLPFDAFVRGALGKVPDSTELIAPKIGGVIRDGVQNFTKKYAELVRAGEDGKKTVAVCYIPDGGYTAKMADIIAKALSENGVNIYMADAAGNSVGEALNSADALVIGASTLHRNAKKEIWDAVTSLNAVRVNGKPYFVFGSYGWSGEGLELVHQHLKMLRMKPFLKPIGVLFNPSEKDIRELTDTAARFAETLL